MFKNFVKKMTCISFLAGCALALVYCFCADYVDFGITVAYLALHLIGSTVWTPGLLGSTCIMVYAGVEIFQFSVTLGVIWMILLGFTYGSNTVMSFAESRKLKKTSE